MTARLPTSPWSVDLSLIGPIPTHAFDRRFLIRFLRLPFRAPALRGHLEWACSGDVLTRPFRVAPVTEFEDRLLRDVPIRHKQGKRIDSKCLAARMRLSGPVSRPC